MLAFLTGAFARQRWKKTMWSCATVVGKDRVWLGATHFDRFNRFSRSRSCWWLHIIWFPRSFPFGFINLSSRPRTHVAVNPEARGPSGLHHMDALQHELWNVVGTHATTATETPMAFASKERQCQHGCEGLNCPAIGVPVVLYTCDNHV